MNDLHHTNQSENQETSFDSQENSPHYLRYARSLSTSSNATVDQYDNEVYGTKSVEEYTSNLFREARAVIDPNFLPKSTGEKNEFKSYIEDYFQVQLTINREGDSVLCGSWDGLTKARRLLIDIYQRQRLDETKPLSYFLLREEVCPVDGTRQSNLTFESEQSAGSQDEEHPEVSFDVETIKIDTVQWKIVQQIYGYILWNIQEKLKVGISAEECGEETTVTAKGGLAGQAIKQIGEIFCTVEKEYSTHLLIDVNHYRVSPGSVPDEIKNVQDSYKRDLYISFDMPTCIINIYGREQTICLQARTELEIALKKLSDFTIKRVVDAHKKNRIPGGPVPTKQIGSEKPASSASRFDSELLLLYEGTLAKGLRVKVCQGDITKLRVDVIVSAANSSLSNTAGVAKAISQGAGPSLQKSCDEYIKTKGHLGVTEAMSTRAGRLKASYVLHVVGPKWDDYHDKNKCGDDLHRTFNNCFRQAENVLKATSMAMPAISSGAFGIPKDIVADTIYCATVMFDAKARERSLLKEITFITIDTDINLNLAEIFKTNDMKPTNRNQGNRRRGKTSACQTTVRHGNQSTGSYRPEDGRQQYNMDKRGANYEQDFPPLGRFEEKQPPHETTDIPKRRHSSNDQEEDNCTICLDTITNERILPKCKHTFCKDCIDQWFQVKGPKCPVCGEMYGLVTGDQPEDGTMHVNKCRGIHLPGYQQWDTYVITYNFPSGTQSEQHPNPGKYYKGTNRTAYLPANKEGKEILDLLNKAFKARVTFTIGRSNTTGRDDVVTWNDIHHKTSISGGPTKFGYPDLDYLKRVREELSAKGIK